jgi:hypothetical protein
MRFKIASNIMPDIFGATRYSFEQKCRGGRNFPLLFFCFQIDSSPMAVSDAVYAIPP